MSASHKPLVFSGMQPTGNIHLGNYLGAIKNWIPMQKETPCIFCVVDMHSLTIWVDPKELRENTRMIAAAYIAGGIDPKLAPIFPQSRYQLGVAQGVIERYQLGNRARVVRFGTASRFTGERRTDVYAGLPQLLAADQQYWLNARPRKESNE